MTICSMSRSHKLRRKEHLMRKLASIQRIEWLRPIEGRDRIELAGVLGWQVIVKKGEFHVGELCIYVEIDSILRKSLNSSFFAARISVSEQ